MKEKCKYKFTEKEKQEHILILVSKILMKYGLGDVCFYNVKVEIKERKNMKGEKEQVMIFSPRINENR